MRRLERASAKSCSDKPLGNEAASGSLVTDVMRETRSREVPWRRGRGCTTCNSCHKALDGSEDDSIRGSAKKLWQDACMEEGWLRANAEVDELVQSEVITGSDQWQQVIRHPADPGAKVLEGEEFEGVARRKGASGALGGGGRNHGP